jgi:hypothetical protein
LLAAGTERPPAAHESDCVNSSIDENYFPYTKAISGANRKIFSYGPIGPWNKS